MPLTIPPQTGAPDPAYATAAEVLSDLPALTTVVRNRRALTVAQAAAQIGVSTTTLSGLEAGSNCTRATATAVLRWLAT